MGLTPHAPRTDCTSLRIRSRQSRSDPNGTARLHVASTCGRATLAISPDLVPLSGTGSGEIASRRNGMAALWRQVSGASADALRSQAAITASAASSAVSALVSTLTSGCSGGS